MEFDNENIQKKSEKPFEPGAARYGNFINYYQFNSVSKRLNAIPPNLLLDFKRSPVLCLDIGCNSGELTSGLYSHLRSELPDNIEFFILGIDLDSNLITRCKESNVYTEHITYQQMDIMSDSSQLQLFLQKFNQTQFDLITCFSTTMWIHLHHGDEGLNQFLKFISELGNYLLLEPQKWTSYKSVVRRMKRLQCETFTLEKLKIRDTVDHLLKFLPLECNKYLYKFEETSWNRSLFLFKNDKSI
ncbi:pre-miRNA 5'-monophosphate methyltransferase [Caerostris darwini]|uniref:RNA methyltransferase n=1 Tax=Caerostris darwini TaxID=1538125 RepID=A0AAV4RSX6_9ARAC|nr:pre-miRNA 5'-monophosphate methyltransferase [Caerostris darwini]